MEKGKILKQLIEKQGSIRSFAMKCGIPDSTLRSILKNVGGASVDTIITICNNLNITVEELDCMAKGIPYKGKTFNELQAMIEKERDAMTIEEKNNLIRSILGDNAISKKKNA